MQPTPSVPLVQPTTTTTTTDVNAGLQLRKVGEDEVQQALGGSGEVRLEELPPDVTGGIQPNLIRWLQMKHPEVLRDQSIASISGQLARESTDGPITAEVYTNRYKLKNGKVFETECLKSTIEWEVRLKDGSSLKMAEPFLSQVEYPSKNDVKRFALWANAYVATIKLPLLRDAKALAKINEFAQGNISFNLSNASKMRDHTVVAISLGNNAPEFQIDITNSVIESVDDLARHSLQQSSLFEEEEGDLSVSVTKPEMLREKIFREASLIVVRDQSKRLHNEEIVKFGKIENSDLNHVDGAIRAAGLTPEAYVQHLNSKVKGHTAEFHRFATFFGNKNPRWGGLEMKPFSLSQFTKLYNKLREMEQEIENLEKKKADKNELDAALLQKEIIREEIKSETQLLEVAHANCLHMSLLKESLNGFREQLTALETNNPGLKGAKELTSLIDLQIAEMDEKLKGFDKDITEIRHHIAKGQDIPIFEIEAIDDVP